ncbi:PREDICTED: thioredoxin-related transmembrane protein 1-like [Papilio xuthus]|uniref:Thioredoxin-related transmembrane protein 1-like n=2 Tax=Papilio xuthus TaxID=66420 RepID=A0AAJ6ZT12_PAPXU|nr:PREDICTED: thioredoxin-related transmembrane protein 1-like [Papilio xuthus]
MARVNKSPQVLHFFLYFCITICCFSSYVSATHELDEDNWREILQGEWMVEFYAPWCPACNALGPAWTELTNRAARKNLAVKTAAVDVTKSPGLSGRFVVTALPTIFHVKDGQFRQYKGPRDAEAMLSFVERASWRSTDPLSAWKSPDSLQMSLVAHFFKLSQGLRSVHTMLMETYGLPTWGSYLIFAVGTIFIGALLGLMLVCIIDLLYPPRRPDKVTVSIAEAEQRKKDANKSDDEQELINDDIVDEAEHSQSDGEKNSPSDTEEETTTKAEGAGDDKPSEVRKRRPRKAD